MSEQRAHPHQGERLIESGAPLDGANAVGILIHGRGSSGSDIIRLAGSLSPEGAAARIAWLAPQASGPARMAPARMSGQWVPPADTTPQAKAHMGGNQVIGLQSWRMSLRPGTLPLDPAGAAGPRPRC